MGLSRRASSANLSDFRLGHFRAFVRLAAWPTVLEGSEAMKLILAPSHPFKILYAGVISCPIFVVYLMLRCRLGTEKRLGYKDMNLDVPLSASSAQSYAYVAC